MRMMVGCAGVAGAVVEGVVVGAASAASGTGTFGVGATATTSGAGCVAGAGGSSSCRATASAGSVSGSGVTGRVVGVVGEASAGAVDPGGAAATAVVGDVRPCASACCRA